MRGGVMAKIAMRGMLVSMGKGMLSSEGVGDGMSKAKRERAQRERSKRGLAAEDESGDCGRNGREIWRRG